MSVAQRVVQAVAGDEVKAAAGGVSDAAPPITTPLRSAPLRAADPPQ